MDAVKINCPETTLIVILLIFRPFYFVAVRTYRSARPGAETPQNEEALSIISSHGNPGSHMKSVSLGKYSVAVFSVSAFQQELPICTQLHVLQSLANCTFHIFTCFHLFAVLPNAVFEFTRTGF